jgi:hypothetical protein
MQGSVRGALGVRGAMGFHLLGFLLLGFLLPRGRWR